MERSRPPGSSSGASIGNLGTSTGNLKTAISGSMSSLSTLSATARSVGSMFDSTPLSMRHYKEFLALLFDDKQLTLIETVNELIDKCDSEYLSELIMVSAEARGVGQSLMDRIILKYLANNARSPIALFEDGTFYSKMFTSYFKLVGRSYLWTTFSAAMDSLQKFSGSFEIDPSRMRADQDITSGVQNLQLTAEKFITRLADSIDACPPSIRAICKSLYAVTVTKFNNDFRAGEAAVVRCFFGHLICPAIVMPTSYGLLDVFPRKSSHRGLVLIAKIMQALSEGHLWDDASDCMSVLSSFVKRHSILMSSFVKKLCSPTPEELRDAELRLGATPTFIPDDQVLSCTGGLHMFFHRNNARITEYLAACDASRPDVMIKIGIFNALKIALSDLDTEMSKSASPSASIASGPGGSGDDAYSAFRREISSISLSNSNNSSPSHTLLGSSSSSVASPYSTNSSHASMAFFALTTMGSSSVASKKEIILNNFVYNDEPRRPLVAVIDFLQRMRRLFIEHPWKQHNYNTGLFEFRHKSAPLSSSSLDLAQKLKASQATVDVSRLPGKSLDAGINGFRSLGSPQPQDSSSRKTYSSSSFASTTSALDSGGSSAKLLRAPASSSQPSSPLSPANSLAVPIISERRPSSGLFANEMSSMSGPIDLQAVALSIDFQELTLNLAELRAVNLFLLCKQQHDVLAFWLNVYNLLVLHIHVAAGLPYNELLRKRMMRTFKYDIGGQLYSLEDIMQGILRGNPRGHFKKDDPRTPFVMSRYDPRMHFAVSHLTVSTSPMVVYTAHELSTQLVLISRLFCQQSIDISPAKKKVILPALFDEYFRDFGSYATDVFRWIAQFLTMPQQRELAAILSTCKFDLTFSEPSWEPRVQLLFATTESLLQVDSSSSYISTALSIESVKRYAQIQTQAAAVLAATTTGSLSPDGTSSKRNSYNPPDTGSKRNSVVRSDSVVSTASTTVQLNENSVAEIGVLNQDVTWTRKARKGTAVVEDLLNQLVELCNMFAFEWAAIAGSVEFKAFIYDTSELQKVWLASLTKSEKTAFWINTHNLLALHLCIMHKPFAFMSKLGRKNVFTVYKYCIGGSDFCLRDIECGILTNNFDRYFSKKGDDRGEFAFDADPRAHLGLTLFARGTPSLFLFRAETLAEDLSAHCRSFLSANVKIEPTKNKIELPKWVKRVYKTGLKQKGKLAFVDWLSEIMPPYFLTQFQSFASISSGTSKLKIDLNFESIDWTPMPCHFDTLVAARLEVPPPPPAESELLDGEIAI